MAGKFQEGSYNFVIEFGPIQELGSIIAEPSVIVIRQAFEFFYKVGISPAMIKFDNKAGIYLRVGGYAFNKALLLCLILLAVMVIHGIAVMAVSPSAPQPEQLSNKVLKADMVMNTLLGGACVAFLTSFYWTLFIKFDAFVEILNQNVKVTQKFQQWTTVASPSMRKAQMISSLILSLCVLMALLGTLGYILANGSVHKSMQEIINDLADMEARAAVMLFGHGNVTELNEYRFSATAPTAVTVLVAAVGPVSTFWGQTCWSFGFCVLTVVGVSLWLLLSSLDEQIKLKNEKRFEDIRTFSEVVKIIENVNGIYGLVILFSVLAGVLHFSVDLFTVFKVESDILERLSYLSDFVWFGCTLWATAQVYEEAMKVGVSLRMRFEEEQFLSEMHRIHSGYQREGTDMLLLLHQELNSQNVGLKGHGFFTCSYGFIGTVLGMISTYSVIVIQFQT